MQGGARALQLNININVPGAMTHGLSGAAAYSGGGGYGYGDPLAVEEER